jgi:hypothetical protein
MTSYITTTQPDKIGWSSYLKTFPLYGVERFHYWQCSCALQTVVVGLAQLYCSKCLLTKVAKSTKRSGDVACFAVSSAFLTPVDPVKQ